MFLCVKYRHILLCRVELKRSAREHLISLFSPVKNVMPLFFIRFWKCLFRNSLPLTVWMYKGVRSFIIDLKASVTSFPCLDLIASAKANLEKTSIATISYVSESSLLEIVFPPFRSTSETSRVSDASEMLDGIFF